MQELVNVVSKLKPDNFTPTIVLRTKDFLYVEYQSPILGVREPSLVPVLPRLHAIMQPEFTHDLLRP